MEIQSAPAELPNNYFRAEVGKQLPKQFPEPPPIIKFYVGNSALSHTTKTLKVEITLNIFEGDSMPVTYYLITIRDENVT